jgi:Proteolysis_6 C-terminal/ATP-dependent Clp protease adaptor protein ClpS/Putative zinc finger in N-recognin (UBR box)
MADDLLICIRECGRDPTCVLCARCFHYEAHHGHDIAYTITSHAGGCCDCGDSEAWTVPLYCTLHHQDPKKSSSSYSGTIHRKLGGKIDCQIYADSATHNNHHENNEIDEDIENIVELTATEAALLDEALYILSVLCYFGHAEEDDGVTLTDVLGKKLPSEVTEVQCAVLYNDDVHSFDEVISVLTTAIDCSKASARTLAESVDRDGRAVVCAGATAAQRVTAGAEAVGLVCRTVPALAAYWQDAAQTLLFWLSERAAQNSWMQRAFSQRISAPSTSPPFAPWLRDTVFADRSFAASHTGSPLEILLCLSHLLWQAPRVALKTLLMGTLLKAYTWKLRLAESFTRCYPLLLHAFLFRDKEPELSVLFLSVQLYTVPSVVRTLVRTHHLVTCIVGAIDACFGRRAGVPGTSLPLDQPFITNRRYFHPFQDIRYLLDGCSLADLRAADMPPNIKLSLKSSNNFTDHTFIRSTFNSTFDYTLDPTSCITKFSMKEGLSCGGSLDPFFSVLARFEDLDLNRRAESVHVEFESDDWLHAFNISLQTSRLAKDLAAFVAKEGAADTIWALEQLLSWISNETHFLWRPGHDKANASVGVFSFHHPLHWLASHLIRFLFADVDSKLSEQVSALIIRMAGTSLATQIYASQIRAGLWVRNGLSLKAQLQNYLNPTLRQDMFDLDLFLIHASIRLQPSTVINILGSFNDSMRHHGDPSSAEREARTCFWILAEDLLCLLIRLAQAPINDLAAAAPTFIQHILYIHRGLAFSDILKLLPAAYMEQENLIASTLKAITNTKRTLEKEIYFLKENYTKAIDPFFPYYAHQDVSDCMEKILGSKDSIMLHQIPLESTVVDAYFSSPAFLSLLHSFLHLLYQQKDGSELSLLAILYLLQANRGQHHRVPRDASQDEFFIFDWLLPSQNPPSEDLRSNLSDIVLLLQRVATTNIGNKWSKFISEILRLYITGCASPTPLLQIYSEEPSRQTRETPAQRKKHLLEKFQSAQRQFAASLLKETSENLEKDLLPTNMIATHSGEEELCAMCRAPLTKEDIIGILCNLIQVGTTRQFIVPTFGHQVANTSTSGSGGATKVLCLLSSLSHFKENRRIQAGLTCCRHKLHYTCYLGLASPQENLSLANLLERLIGNADVALSSRATIKCPVCRSQARAFMPLHVPHSESSGRKDSIYSNTNRKHSITPNSSVVMKDLLAPFINGKELTGYEWPYFYRLLQDLIETSERFLRTFPDSLNDPFIISNSLLFKGLLLLNKELDCLHDSNEFSMHQEAIYKDLSTLLSVLPKQEIQALEADPYYSKFRSFVEANTTVGENVGPRFKPSEPFDLLVRASITIWHAADQQESTPHNIDSYQRIVQALLLHFLKAMNLVDSFTDISKNLERPLADFRKSISGRMAEFLLPLCDNILVAAHAYAFLRQAALFGHFLFYSEDDERNSDACLLDCEELFEFFALDKMDYPLAYHIIDLPNQFDELVTRTLKIACGKCGKVPNETAICLFCGRLCCAQSYCCMSQNSTIMSAAFPQQLSTSSFLSVGECNWHMMHECCISFGAFFIIQRAAVLILNGKGKGYIKPAPYLDSHGEADLGLRRGSPLFLDAAQKRHLDYLWLTNAIPTHIDNMQDDSNNPRLWLSM